MTPNLWFRITMIITLLFLGACGGNEETTPERSDVVGLSILPRTVQLGLGETKEFTVSVTGTTNEAVTWTADGGTFIGTGTTTLYTAPDVLGTYTVTVTSEADKSRTAKATVVVSETPPAPTTPGGSPSQTRKSNNSATLSGPSIGSNEVVKPQLRKELDVTLNIPNPDLVLGKAYATSPTVSAKERAVLTIIPVTNVDDQLHCFIRLEAIVYKDARGNTLAEAELDFATGGNIADGSVGDGEAFYNDTCLAPGEQGYFRSISLATTYDEVASLEFESLIYNDFNFAVAATKIIPTRYTLEDNEDFQTIYIDVQSEGPDTVELGLNTLIYLDSDGTPLFWGLAFPADDWDGVLSSGQVNKLAGSVLYEATANEVFVSSSYRRPSSEETERNAQLYALASQGVGSEAFQKLLLDVRNASLEADLEKARQVSE